MSKHTETQLRCGYNSVMPDTVYIETAEGDEIGILEHEDAQEYGGKLVSRYNNHDALVEALKEVMDNLGWVAPKNGVCVMPSHWFLKVKKVLAKAKE